MKEIALVLSGGGARGIAHIGVIRYLEETGHKITSVAGTSMGALVGGMYANGTLADFTEWLLKFTKMDVIRFLDLTVGKGGMIKGEKIMKALEQFMGSSSIENLRIPYACVATDLLTHQEVVYRSGNLLQAVRASISIPTVFLPQLSGDMLLVDGGVLNPMPLDVISRRPGDMLVAVNVNADVPYHQPPHFAATNEHEKQYSKVRALLNEKWSGMIDSYLVRKQKPRTDKTKQMKMFDVISDSIRIAQDRITTFSIEKYPPDVLVNVSYSCGTIFDFYKTEELIEAGRDACKNALNNLKNR